MSKRYSPSRVIDDDEATQYSPAMDVNDGPQFYTQLTQDPLASYDYRMRMNRSIERHVEENDFADIGKLFTTASAKTPRKGKTSTTSSVMCQGVNGLEYMTNTTVGGIYQIKIEILSIKKTEHIEVSERWQHADIRAKIIVKDNCDEIFLDCKGVLGKIAKRVSEGCNRKQFTIARKKM